MKWVKFTDWVSGVLVIIGGVNMGFIGLFNNNFLANLFGDGSGSYRVVLTIIGLAACYMVSFAFRTEDEFHIHAHA
jgi:uncharacterized membrane protein YuzA (DUF378 family)